ncbi:MAG: phosphoribosylanthranilate isomerase [Betaproteobacteria bacterium]|nr:phosphoribosylanthranilate isomerase [Betaproteobacteria bacterium]
MTTAVKICGITRVDDALAAARLGAHALGFVFYAPSPRNFAPARAAEIIRSLPPFVTAVGLFVNPGAREVERVLGEAPLNLLQFHGEETPAFCGRFRVPYLKAVRVRAGLDLLQYAQRYSAASGLLLDAFVEGTHGGTGTAFDRSLIPRELPLPVILSGGLNPENVADAIRHVRPWAVDVSSGVETSPGVKDPLKIAAFMNEVRSADV